MALIAILCVGLGALAVSGQVHSNATLQPRPPLKIVNGNRKVVCQADKSVAQGTIGPSLADFKIGVPDDATLSKIGFHVPVISCDGRQLTDGLYSTGDDFVLYVPAYAKDGIWYPCPPQLGWIHYKDGNGWWGRFETCWLEKH